MYCSPIQMQYFRYGGWLWGLGYRGEPFSILSQTMPSLLPLISTPTFAVIKNDNDGEFVISILAWRHFLEQNQWVGFADQKHNDTAPEVESYILQTFAIQLVHVSQIKFLKMSGKVLVLLCLDYWSIETLMPNLSSYIIRFRLIKYWWQIFLPNIFTKYWYQILMPNLPSYIIRFGLIKYWL